VIYVNISSGSTRQERFKRGAKCFVVFFAVFIFFNSATVQGNVKHWRVNPVGSSIWLILSLMLSFWMAMWTSQCTVIMDENSTTDYTSRQQGSRRHHHSIVPLPQDMIQLEELKQQVLQINKRSSYNQIIIASQGRILSSDEMICSVCLNIFVKESNVRETRCHHIFCADCFESFIDIIRTSSALICPMCRSPLTNLNTEEQEEQHTQQHTQQQMEQHTEVQIQTQIQPHTHRQPPHRSIQRVRSSEQIDIEEQRIPHPHLHSQYQREHTSSSLSSSSSSLLPLNNNTTIRQQINSSSSSPLTTITTNTMTSSPPPSSTLTFSSLNQRLEEPNELNRRLPIVRSHSPIEFFQTTNHHHGLNNDLIVEEIPTPINQSIDFTNINFNHNNHSNNQSNHHHEETTDNEVSQNIEEEDEDPYRLNYTALSSNTVRHSWSDEEVVGDNFSFTNQIVVHSPSLNDL